MNKKGLSAVVVVLLLLGVTLLASMFLQGWLTGFTNDIISTSSQETKAISFSLSIERVVGDDLLIRFNSDEVANIKEVIIGNSSCVQNRNVTEGISSISVTNCTEDVAEGRKEVTIITESGVISKYVRFDAVKDAGPSPGSSPLEFHMTSDWNSGSGNGIRIRNGIEMGYRDVDNNLNGYWDLNGNLSGNGSLIREISGKGNNASISGGHSQVKDGILDSQSIHLDGKDGMLIVPYETFPSAVSFWMKNTSNQWTHILKQGDETYQNAEKVNLTLPFYDTGETLLFGAGEKGYRPDISQSNGERVLTDTSLNTLGVATDGDKLYFDNSGNSITVVAFNGTEIGTHQVSNLGGTNNQLTMAGGHLYTRNNNAIYHINRTSWTSTPVNLDTSYPLQTGDFWMDFNLLGTVDGRIATVSSPSSPPFTIRLYSISGDGKTFIWDEDIQISEGVNVDNHGFALVGGRYLVLITFKSGAKVWDIHEDHLVEDISWDLRPNNVGNPTFVAHDHWNKRIIVGDYRDRDFVIYNDTLRFQNMSVDAIRTYSSNLSRETIDALSFHAPNYSVSYISEEFNPKGKRWDLFNITASIPAASAIDLHYESLGDNDSVLVERTVSLANATNIYPISPIESPRARIRLNLTTDSIERLVKVSNLSLKAGDTS